MRGFLAGLHDPTDRRLNRHLAILELKQRIYEICLRGQSEAWGSIDINKDKTSMRSRVTTARL